MFPKLIYRLVWFSVILSFIVRLHSCEDSSNGCQAILVSCAGPGQHVAANIFEHLACPDGLHGKFQDDVASMPQEKLVKVFSCASRLTMHCLVHDDECVIEDVDFDVSGIPCIDYGPSGSQKGIYGPTFSVFLSFFHWHRSKRTKVVFIENVPELPVDVVRFLLGDIYYVYVFYMRPGDVGFELLSRLRVFFMCLLKGLVGLLQMCCFAYDQMC